MKKPNSNPRSSFPKKDTDRATLINEMKPISLSIFWKFTISILLIVTVFGYFTMYMVEHEVGTLLREEFDNRGQFITNSFAKQIDELISHADENELASIAENIARFDSTIAFFAILDTAKNQPVAIYFNSLVFPDDFERKSKLNAGDFTPIKFSTSSKYNVRNFMAPVNEAGRWFVHVGLVEYGVIKKELLIKKRFITMVYIFLALGILGAFVFSYMITKPLRSIGEQARALNLESLSGASQQVQVSRGRLWQKDTNFMMKDEIDTLIEQFNDMIHRLSLSHKELRKAQNDLIHAEKMSAIGTLVAGICHNINNPISGLKNCIHRISKAPENIEQNKKYLPIMSEAVSQAENILSELLAFSRKEDVEYEYFDIREPIEKVVSILSFTFEEYRISFTKKYPKTLPEAYGNKNQIEQVILNIVKNSIDAIATLQTSGRDDILGEIIFQLDTDGERLKLDISDNGVGMEADKLLQIFDPFFTTKKKSDGTGLGLSVSYNIIEAHQGEIFASKNAGHGLTFTVLLPLHFSRNSNPLT